MAIPESLMKDNYFIPVDNSPEKAEENGYVQDKPSFTSSSAKKTSGITFSRLINLYVMHVSFSCLIYIVYHSSM